MKCGHLRRLAALAVGLIASTGWAIPIRTVALTGQAAPGAPANRPEFGIPFSSPSINDAGKTAFIAQANLLRTPGALAVTGIWSEGGGGTLQKVALNAELAPGALGARVFNQFQSPRVSDSGHTAFFTVLSNSQVNDGNPTAAVSALYSAPSAGAPQLVAAGSHPLDAAPPGWLLFGVQARFLQNGAGELAFLGDLVNPGPPQQMGLGVGTTRGGQTTVIKDTESIFLESISGVAINDAGQIAYHYYDAGLPYNLSLWLDSGVELTEIARTGLPAPGQPAGVAYDTVTTAKLNNAGQVTFGATLLGPTIDATNDYVIYEGSVGSLRIAYQEGQPAPGTPAGTVFGVGGSVLNGAGRIAIAARLTGPDVTEANDRGLWREGDAGLELVMREGDAAPGVPAGLTFASLQVQNQGNPSFNRNGQVAFLAQLGGPGVTTANDLGIWATDLAGRLNLVVREGDLFDVNDDPLIEDLRTVRVIRPFNGSGGESGEAEVFNEAGQLVFALELRSGSTTTGGVFVANTAVPEPGSVALMASVAVALFLGQRRR